MILSLARVRTSRSVPVIRCSLRVRPWLANLESVHQLSRDLESTIDLLAGKSIALLTGAGVSTDSGLPDYRGEGAPPRRVMQASQFLDDPEFRARFWAGSQLGWKTMANVSQSR